MKVLENIPLAGLTTFRVGGSARYFSTVKSEDDIITALAFARERNAPIFILGGGSNIVVPDGGFPGLVIKMELSGMSFQDKGEGKFRAVVAAGEGWDAFVAETVRRGLWGLENLSHIPGTVGAAPVQNIGAYGVEVGGAIISVRALDRETGAAREFSNEECRFGYRDSFFKTAFGKRWIITSVTFDLNPAPQPNVSYKDLAEHFAGRAPSQAEIRDAVIAIRKNKFPDLSETGTAGSFWKNPIIPQSRFAELSERYPGMPSFPAGTGDSRALARADDSQNMLKIPLA
ncbi:MAG: FAD-binding protein, partial [Patescibacteria group bacterium]|nr:FAD-binding protein [Patescibacteria group bacterium]